MTAAPTTSLAPGKAHCHHLPAPLVSDAGYVDTLEWSTGRGASFKDPWIYAAVMSAVGLLYLGYLLIRRGRPGLVLPMLASIDAALAPAPDPSGHS